MGFGSGRNQAGRVAAVLHNGAAGIQAKGGEAGCFSLLGMEVATIRLQARITEAKGRPSYRSSTFFKSALDGAERTVESGARGSTSVRRRSPETLLRLWCEHRAPWRAFRVLLVLLNDRHFKRQSYMFHKSNLDLE